MRTLTMLARLALFLLCLPVQGGIAREVPSHLRGHWTANSTTALGVTGNITLTPSAIIFQNGVSFGLSDIGKRVGVSIETGLPAAEVFRLRNPMDVRLLHGNTLCALVPRYLAFAVEQPGPSAVQSIEAGTLVMTVIDGRATPTNSLDHARICGDYAYRRSR